MKCWRIQNCHSPLSETYFEGKNTELTELGDPRSRLYKCSSTFAVSGSACGAVLPFRTSGFIRRGPAAAWVFELLSRCPL